MDWGTEMRSFKWIYSENALYSGLCSTLPIHLWRFQRQFHHFKSLCSDTTIYNSRDGKLAFELHINDEHLFSSDSWLYITWQKPHVHVFSGTACHQWHNYTNHIRINDQKRKTDNRWWRMLSRTFVSYRKMIYFCFVLLYQMKEWATSTKMKRTFAGVLDWFRDMKIYYIL